MNILQTRTEAFITPTKPNILSEDRIYVYVPKATSTNAGIASYDNNDFIVTNGDVSLNREMRDAHTRPEVVLLDSEYFPKETVIGTDGRYYYKYKTSAIHYIVQNLTDEQKQIARENIDAISNSDLVTALLNYYTKDNTYNKTEVDNKLSNYYTKDNTYNKTEINELISVIPKFDIEVVTELPTTNISVSTIYLVVRDETEPDLYDEYIYVNNTWELLGSQQIDYSVTADRVFSVIEDSESIVSKVENDKLIFEVNGKLVNSENIYTLIEDSDTIVSMINNNDKIKFELAANLTNRLNKALITPMSAPSAIELVAIDNRNSQTMIGIGDGLVYENGMLRAIPQSSGDDGVVVQDTLVSQDTTAALSAKQGNVLYNMIIDANRATNSAINETELNAQKYVLIGADGVLEGNVYNFTIDNPETYIGYRTNLTRFLIDLNLPVVGEIDSTKEVTITFGDTSYYVHNILKGMEHVTIGDLQQVEKYSNATGYRFITEMIFFETNDMVGFAIIPTISMNDILSLSSDEMDNYMADGGLSQGQLAICSDLGTNNGYELGSLYKFVITYPTTYAWIKIENTYIELNVPQTAVQGAITNDQFTILKANDNNGILFNHEYYQLSTKGRLEGYRTYFTIERENGKTSIKTITITESTLAWVLAKIDVETEPVDETYTISSDMWQELSENDPYKFMVSVTANYTIGTETEVGIINNQPALFANYGFIVGSVSNQTVIIYTVSKPAADVNLSVRFRR